MECGFTEKNGHEVLPLKLEQLQAIMKKKELPFFRYVFLIYDKQRLHNGRYFTFFSSALESRMNIVLEFSIDPFEGRVIVNRKRPWKDS